ncbi:homoserine O-acetyltransferase MetX [Sulfobacillus harzensis]|uniref:Homoserine O-acetyltransferase n=1 Tax=Sulfobacillus harzensis TaxID=2729629 RepID=A0A7Y0L2G4_9FIRM|nr:homoserine O-acetyltransferase [Sulfobacillus harzensis]NMP21787.1 homoserine O-acetyltransferase [Sulfobacillus harzensis]
MEAKSTEPVRPWQVRQGFPWPGLQFFEATSPLALDNGGQLFPWQLAYEEWGPASGQPVVVFHALTGDSHVASHPEGGPPGWWERVLGPGKGLDSEKFHVLCFNVLGGAMGSSGPASCDESGKPWGSRFPDITLFDMARAAHLLIHAWRRGPVRLIGGSMGGMLALAYAALYPAEVSAVMAIGAPIQHDPWAIAYHTVGRTAIMADVHFRGGDYYDGPAPEQGLALARMADMISYQHPESMNRKFGRGLQPGKGDQFQIASYLSYQGEKLVGRFDANTYLVLTRAMDRFELSEAHIQAIRTIPVWMVGLESDLLYLPEEIARHARRLEDGGVAVRLSWLSGPWGHDTFLVEQEAMGRLAAQFLKDAES